MKMTLEFDDQEEFRRIAMADRMAEALWEWNEYMRQVWREKIPTPTMDEMHDRWKDNIDGINFEDIYS